jgi:two-component system response regulator AtoC
MSHNLHDIAHLGLRTSVEPRVISSERVGPMDDHDELGLTAVTAVVPGGAIDDSPPGHLQLFVIGRAMFDAHPLKEAGTLTIGRSSQCDIEVDDRSISRRHAVLSVGETVTIEDLGSANGTFVRGQRIASGSPAVISVGELVALGSASIILQRSQVSAKARGPVAKDTATSAGADVVVSDPRMRGLHRLVEQVAGSSISVLLLGETGVGKEVFARAVHRASPRAAGPFVEVNCAALTETLLESELFGHERGAFTSAVSAKPGLLETADGGTLLLDEIGDMSLSTQAKLLRVIEDSQLRRVGGLKPRHIDVRFVAATNSDIETQVEQGTFRRDLFFRLNGVTILIPPLRERPAEIEPLARAFIRRCRSPGGGERPELAPEALEWLRHHPWPGNVRELRNVIERAVLLCGSGPILPEHLSTRRPTAQAAAGDATARPGPWPRDARLHAATDVDVRVPMFAARPRKGSQEEEQWIMQTLAQAGGNQTVAARLLGISRRTLVNRLNAYEQVDRPRKKPKAYPSG